MVDTSLTNLRVGYRIDRTWQVRLDVFNLFNRTNFGAPNGNRSSTAFGTITSLATTPRQVQLGVKVNF
jgi:outer membrane receptor protein involved in Fe transport